MDDDMNTQNDQGAAATTGDDGGAGKVNDAIETFNLFKTQLFTELKMNDLPEEERKRLEDKLEQLINVRMVNLLMIYLPDDKVEEFAKIIEEDNVEKMMEAVDREIPNFGDLVSNELVAIRDEILAKYIKSNAKQ